jgi:DNA-binding MurR/RpiR family transcriptional regulator
LAKAAGVSESAVVRFAQKLGYRGYPELRQEFQETLRSRIGRAQRLRRTVTGLPQQNVIESLFRRDIELLEATVADLSQKDFSKAVDLIWGARRIFVIGLRSSFALAYFLYFRLIRLGLDVHLIMITGGASLIEQLALMQSNDLLVVIGFDRIPLETRIAIDHAIKMKVVRLGITHFRSSEIARKVNVCLVAKRRPHAAEGLTAPLSLLNALAVSVANQRRRHSFKALTRLDRMEAYYQKSPKQ